MQKTITINGRQYNGRKIASLINRDDVTNGGDYIVNIGGVECLVNLRQVQDQYYAPVVDSLAKANAIEVLVGYNLWPNQRTVWLSL